MKYLIGFSFMECQESQKQTCPAYVAEARLGRVLWNMACQKRGWQAMWGGLRKLLSHTIRPRQVHRTNVAFQGLKYRENLEISCLVCCVQALGSNNPLSETSYDGWCLRSQQRKTETERSKGQGHPQLSSRLACTIWNYASKANKNWNKQINK